MIFTAITVHRFNRCNNGSRIHDSALGRTTHILHVCVCVWSSREIRGAWPRCSNENLIARLYASLAPGNGVNGVKGVKFRTAGVLVRRPTILFPRCVALLVQR